MATFTPGFHGHRRTRGGRLPPGQFLTEDFPVLSAGPTPDIPLDRWEFTLTAESGERRRWNWQEFSALPQQEVTTDLHCVTRWSKFDTRWRGVSLDTLLNGVTTDARHALAECHGGYTTNLPLTDLRGGKAWIAHTYDGEPLTAEHGGPARLLVPHLYFWKSAKWISGITLRAEDHRGFWEQLGYHDHGDPWREQRTWND
ncbi:DMSO/TMAO reductase YedYZ molybdopterin-dependent catalytic subunit [Kitasatospora sp. SolWspMP-SS2h]|uniref:sulfite oxidase-like oxidoreductase n=1 Tax=Kitasatospora sp. SolWspMP-SS2h TaxID=1305729 RepID=UPI000DBAC2CE|nr:sulfite oxidase-like oxidoreductase [Kitasatospora sp. SolWspMP-SS2h]RAJ31291.1 DMSO/TMAO reductase YedYZ molybdopterin-dependent catalytic subunit [Kitasatospora sp. SolWspMP-SS2h]